jgi:hypothetical protein
MAGREGAGAASSSESSESLFPERVLNAAIACRTAWRPVSSTPLAAVVVLPDLPSAE